MVNLVIKKQNQTGILMT